MKLDLDKLWGKDIKLTDVEGNVWNGFVDGVTDRNNTPDCKDEITLMIDFRYHSFYDDEIKSIEILD